MSKPPRGSKAEAEAREWRLSAAHNIDLLLASTLERAVEMFQQVEDTNPEALGMRALLEANSPDLTQLELTYLFKYRAALRILKGETAAGG